MSLRVSGGAFFRTRLTRRRAVLQQIHRVVHGQLLQDDGQLPDPSGSDDHLLGVRGDWKRPRPPAPWAACGKPARPPHRSAVPEILQYPLRSAPAGPRTPNPLQKIAGRTRGACRTISRGSRHQRPAAAAKKTKHAMRGAARTACSVPRKRALRKQARSALRPPVVSDPVVCRAIPYFVQRVPATLPPLSFQFARQHSAPRHYCTMPGPDL